MLDIRGLADLAAEKIRGGYNAPHAARSALKDLEIPAEEREQLFHDILSELSRRSRARRKKNKTKKIKGNKPFDTSSLGQDESTLSSCSSLAVIKNDPKRLEEALKKEREIEAYRMMYERGDHLLPDP
ncbi:MAG TPA: hypothetical protein VJB70_02950 [Candidatus Paceibacterota bacterium]